MKKISLTRAIVVAGAMAVAGIGAAQADAIFYPDGTSVELGANGADSVALASDDASLMAMDNSADTSVLGAGPATTTTTTTTVSTPVQYEYVQPNINWDRGTALRQMHEHAHLMRRHTFEQASLNRTGVGGPVAMNSGERVIVGSYTIPASDIAGNPYYVFSY